ncbi:MAG TPA: hypothetical protein VK149_09435 [Sideroxyarcus sp.]|nr:hypothetical protein [Sideroxyarcus sp.]
MRKSDSRSSKRKDAVGRPDVWIVTLMSGHSSDVTQCPANSHISSTALIIRFSVVQQNMPPTIIEPRKRGRPPTHPVDRLRTRLWFHVVKLRSELQSPGAIELKVDGEHVRKRDVDVLRPTKWGFYEKGEKVPDDKPGPRNAIEQAEATFPGAARWFRSPIWAVLRGEKLDRRALELALQGLQNEVVEILFELKPREHEPSIQLKPFDADCESRLSMLGSFDALAATVLLAALAEEIASPELRETSLRIYFDLQSPIMEQPETRPFYAELFSLIDLRCKHWAFPSQNQRLDVVIFWQGVQDKQEDIK